MHTQSHKKTSKCKSQRRGPTFSMKRRKSLISVPEAKCEACSLDPSLSNLRKIPIRRSSKTIHKDREFHSALRRDGIQCADRPPIRWLAPFSSNTSEGANVVVVGLGVPTDFLFRKEHGICPGLFMVVRTFHFSMVLKFVSQTLRN